MVFVIMEYFVMDMPLFCRSDCNTTKSSFVMIQRVFYRMLTKEITMDDLFLP